MVATHFSGNAIKIGGFWGFWKTRFFGQKWWNYFLPVFKAPQKMGVTLFLAFFFLLFFLFLLHLARGCSKKTIFIGFLFAHTLLKHLVTSCSNNQVKPKLPQKKVHNFFVRNLFVDQKQLSKTLILHHPLKTVHTKSQKKTYFYRLKKRWPSYWPYGGQVIDLKMAKMWPSYWPYSIYIYERRCKFISRIHADLVFGRVSRFWGVSRHLALQQGKS